MEFCKCIFDLERDVMYPWKIKVGLVGAGLKVYELGGNQVTDVEATERQYNNKPKRSRVSLNFCKSCMNAADECCGWLPAFACAHEPFPFFVWLY